MFFISMNVLLNTTSCISPKTVIAGLEPVTRMHVTCAYMYMHTPLIFLPLMYCRIVKWLHCFSGRWRTDQSWAYKQPHLPGNASTPYKTLCKPLGEERERCTVLVEHPHCSLHAVGRKELDVISLVARNPAR